MNPRKVLRIARWEVGKNAGGIDRKTVGIVLATGLLLAVLAPLVASSGVGLDEGIYRVSVDDDSPIERVVANDSTFAVVDDEGEIGRSALGDEIDLLIRGDTVLPDTSDKGQAAASELRDSVSSYNDAVMRGEANQSAAFPVTVTLQYVDRDLEIQVGDGDDDSDGSGADSGGGGGGGGTGGNGGTSGDGTGDSGGSTGGGGVGGGSLPELARSLTGSDSATGSPSDISPPFPFQSLVLAFVFVLPLNFVIQAYGSTILSERLNRRGELMLVSPVTRGDIIAGKTLPYFAGAMVLEGLITGGIMLARGGDVGGLYSVGAVLPLVVLFLGATFLGAMFARSFKELTFVTVAITVSLTTYAFVPAIFTDVTPIALISPLTIVVRDLAGQQITLTAFAFSTLPPFLTAGLFFGLGTGLYREEDMFTQRPIPLKAMDALAGRIKRARSLVLLVAVLMPFVIVAELLVVALFFALPTEFALPAVLFLIAVIEELAKGLPIYAGFVHRRYGRSLRSAVVAGALAGLGFFVAEKGLLAVRFALEGIGGQIPAAQEALFATSGPTGESALLVAGALLLAPLALHVVTAAMTAVGGRKGRRGFALGLTGAILLHFAYNLTIITVVSDLV